MREIEFRGKVSNGEWIYGGYIQAEAVICTKTASIKFYVDPETVGLYTGLKDKNSMNIFEWDIIRFGNETYKIVYDDACFWISQEGRYSMELHTVFGQGDIRVIGNIHDNPELLKEANKGQRND